MEDDDGLVEPNAGQGVSLGALLLDGEWLAHNNRHSGSLIPPARPRKQRDQTRVS